MVAQPAPDRQQDAPLLPLVPAFLERLRTTSAFYRARLDQVDVDAVNDLESFRALPLMAKRDTLADQAAAPPFGTILSVARSEIRQVHLTSGTSGFGQEAFALAAEDVDAIGDAWGPLFDHAGLQAGDVVLVLYPVTFLAVSRSLVEAGRRHGLIMMPLSGVDRSLTASVIERLQPVAVVGRAAVLTLIADALEAAGGDPRASSITSVLTAGLSAEQSVALGARFGAAVFEYYGCSQIGTVAGATCGSVGDAHRVIHLEHERWIFEVIDPTSHEPVDDGHEGELVVSTPLRRASPLLRFRMGDRVILRRHCPCGGGWGIEAGSIGRYDEMRKVRGNNIWPTQLDACLLVHPAASDYRAAHTVDARGIDGLDIVVATGAPASEHQTLVAELTSAVKRQTNVTPRLRLVRDLPEPGTKPQRWVSEEDLGDFT